MALSQTRACLDREHHIALAVMCGVTFERFMAYDANKPVSNLFTSIKESDWNKHNKDSGHRLRKIRNKAVHSEHVHEFDLNDKNLALEAWDLLRGLIPILTRKPSQDMGTVVTTTIAPPLK